jgi:phosphatidylethanolamine-binding protein (PEBP) family uncharacterized protein
MKRVFGFTIFAVILAVAGFAKAADLGVEFTWEGTKACSGKPPAFKITAIPDGTKTLKFLMTDLDMRSFYHGGGEIEYKGSGDIPAGAFGYTGPCPPTGEVHRYRWTVEALNADDDTLAEGEATKNFPP